MAWEETGRQNLVVAVEVWPLDALRVLGKAVEEVAGDAVRGTLRETDQASGVEAEREAR